MTHLVPSASAVTEGEVRFDGSGAAQAHAHVGEEEKRSRLSTLLVMVICDEGGTGNAIAPPKA